MYLYEENGLGGFVICNLVHAQLETFMSWCHSIVGYPFTRNHSARPASVVSSDEWMLIQNREPYIQLNLPLWTNLWNLRECFFHDVILLCLRLTTKYQHKCLTTDTIIPILWQFAQGFYQTSPINSHAPQVWATSVFTSLRVRVEIGSDENCTPSPE